MKSVIHAACPHDCPDACGVLITIEDGRATKIQGDPAHPVTRGFLCAKVAKYLDRVYAPERVLYPMRRRKGVQKGGGTKDFADFEPISWDDAFNEIVARFEQIIRQFGPEAILPYSYGGNLGVLNGGVMDRRFFHRLGASQLDRAICSAAGEAGIISVYGRKLGTEPEQFRHSKVIIAWGANIHGNNVHLWPFIEEARRNGGKLVVIDPYRTRTAKCADWYLPINPGTDVALALGMMHVIITENLYDADYVGKHTLGFDQLRARVQDYSPGKVSHWTGISADDIRTLAREYANTRPAAIRVNYGVQRNDQGGMAVRAICMLPCITGSWKQVGGGLQLSTSHAFAVWGDSRRGKDLMKTALGRPARVINMNELGKVLHTAGDPPVKALFVYNSNPAAVAPNHNTVVRGLRRDDLFTVVHDQFLTDTCDYADIVLPATTFFEHTDLMPSYGHYYLQLSKQAIEPLGEAKSNFDLFRELGQRFGFEEACFQETAEQTIDAALAIEDRWQEGIDRARLERDGHARLRFGNNGHQDPFLPFANGGFFTRSGKAELYNDSLIQLGLDPVASFTPAPESRHGDKTKFPFEMLARKADNFLNSTFANLPGTRAVENPALLEIHPQDASARQIHDGQPVRVFNDRGEIRLIAKLTDAVQPGVLGARLDWAKHHASGVNVNVLTSERLTDMGGGATFYTVLVDVQPL
jgi:molybdopterin guanine dinucleotide-containing S/N-oxide reductase-like protein